MKSSSPKPPSAPESAAPELFLTLMDLSSEGVAVVGPDGAIESVNRAFTAITGYEASEAVGQNPRLLKSDRHDKAFYEAMWASIASTGAWEGEIWNRRKSGEAYPEFLRIRAVRDASGAVERYVSVFRDLSEAERRRRMLLEDAYQDALTGLPNRHLFLDRLSVALKRVRQEGGVLGVICMDLDRFKAVNDSMGYVAGDIALTEVAARLTRLLRQGDTLSRFDGDCFYMMLGGLRDPEDAAHVAGRVLSSLAEPLEIRGREVHVGASLGLTIAPSDAGEPGELIRNAEMAMYRSKEEGRGSFSFFTEELGSLVLKGLQMENDLRKALSRGEFVLHYQPRVDLASGTVAGMEALVRWAAPDGRLVGPGEFIPLAEEAGLIGRIGSWVIEEACRQTKQWADEGLAGLRVSVNLSPRQFENPGLADHVAETLSRTGLSPRDLEVEVTESVFIKGFDQAREALLKLAALGVSVALDDFGTGYSSLAYLKRLPISTLKIDKSFVSGLPGDKDDAAIVTSIVSIATTLSLEVVAEGVETQEQLDFLRSLGCCGGFQGYLFSRPLPAHEFAALASRGTLGRAKGCKG